MSKYTTHSIMYYVIRNSWLPKYISGHPAGHPKLLQLKTPLWPYARFCVLHTSVTSQMLRSELSVDAHRLLQRWWVVDCNSLSLLLAAHRVRTTTASLWQQSKGHLPTGDDHQEVQVTPGSERSRMTWNVWISVWPRHGGRQLIEIFGVQLWTQDLSINVFYVFYSCHFLRF